MATYTINTYGNGDVIWQILQGVVLMMGSGYESLLRLGGVLLVLGMLAFFIARGRIVTHIFFGMLLILWFSFTIKANVIVHDLVNAWIPDRVIADVPLAVAFPAYLTSEAGYRLMVLEQTAFLMPPEYMITNSTFNRAFYDMQKTLSVQLPTGDLQANLTGYLQNCVFREVDLNQLQQGTLDTAPDLLAAILTDNPTLLVPLIVNGNKTGTATCPTMYNTIILPGMAPGNPSYDLAMQQLRRVLGVQDIVGEEEIPIGQFLTDVMSSGQTARQAINTMLIRERWEDAQRLDAESGSDTAAAISNMQKQLGEDLKSQSFANSYVSARFLPLLRTIAEAAVYVLTPLALALAFTPAMFGTLKSVGMAYVWLMLWAPIYVVVNYVIFADGQSQVLLVLPSVGRALTIATYTDVADVLGSLNSFASNIVWSVPSLAGLLTYGLSSASSALIGGASGAQTAAAHEGSAYAHGEGKYVHPGQHLAWQGETSIDTQGGQHFDPQAYIGGPGGILIDYQNGSRQLQMPDGGSLGMSPDGTQSYSGPSGHWSRNAEGQLLGGVYRHESFDERSGQQVLMQTEASGSIVENKFSYRGHDGVERATSEVWDQGTNQRLERTERMTKDGMVETRRVDANGAEEFSRTGLKTVLLHTGKDGRELQASTGVVTLSGRRDAGAEHDTLGHATFASTMDGETKKYTGELKEDDNGLLHFHATEGGSVSGLEKIERGAVRREEQKDVNGGGTQYTRIGGTDALVKVGGQPIRPVSGHLIEQGVVDKSDPNHPQDRDQEVMLTSHAGEFTELYRGHWAKDEHGNQYLDVTDYQRTGGGKTSTSGVFSVGDRAFAGTKVTIGDAQDLSAPWMLMSDGIELLPGGKWRTASGLFADGQFHQLSTREGEEGHRMLQNHQIGELGKGWVVSGEATYFGNPSDRDTPFLLQNGEVMGPDFKSRKGTFLVNGDHVVDASMSKGIQELESGDVRKVDDKILRGSFHSLGDPSDAATPTVFNGWMTDSAHPKGYHTNALLQDGHIVYDSSKSGHEALRVDFEKELTGSEIRHTGWQKIHDADNGMDMLARVDLYYGQDTGGKRQLIGGFVSNVTNAETSQFMVDGKTGKQVWGIHNEKIAPTPEGGTARAGSLAM